MMDEKAETNEKVAEEKQSAENLISSGKHEGIKITLLEDFISACISNDENTVAHRGQPNTKDVLLSSVGRRWKKYPKNKTGEKEFRQHEHDALLFFKRYAIQYLDFQVNSDLDFLALAQHHGVPTRLIDWTFNPLVALFFAVNKDFNKDGIVFSIFTSGTYLDDLEKTLPDPFDVPGFRTFIPLAVTPRVAAQDGLFTIQTDPRITLEVENKDLVVSKYIIPKEFKKEIANDLHSIGVHNLSLFPDLDGVGAWVRMTQYGEY